MNKRVAACSFVLIVAANSLKAQTLDIPKNMCGTGAPPAQWEERFQTLSAQAAASGAGNRVMSLYTIPVIIHVIHGGQPVGS